MEQVQEVINEEELLARGRNNSTVISVRVNNKLLDLVNRKLKELNQLGIRLNKSDLINMLLLAFIKAEINVNTQPIQINAEINIHRRVYTCIHNTTHQIRQKAGIPLIPGRVYTTLHHTTPHAQQYNKYNEVKALLRKAETLRLALINAKSEKKKRILKDKVEELAGKVLEMLAGDNSQQAGRYEKAAKALLKGIQEYFR